MEPSVVCAPAQAQVPLGLMRVRACDARAQGYEVVLSMQAGCRGFPSKAAGIHCRWAGRCAATHLRSPPVQVLGLLDGCRDGAWLRLLCPAGRLVGHQLQGPRGLCRGVHGLALLHGKGVSCAAGVRRRQDDMYHRGSRVRAWAACAAWLDLDDGGTEASDLHGAACHAVPAELLHSWQ